MRYYLHVEQDEENVRDEEGVTLPDLPSARELAIKAAAQLAAEDLANGVERLTQFVIVEDELGTEVFRVRVEAVLEVLGPCASA